MKKVIVIVIIILIIIAAAGVVTYKYINSRKEGSDMLFTNKFMYKNITDDEAKAELDKDKNIIVLDVRTQDEYNQGHIPNSILIPVNELEKRAVTELPDKKAKIFVYCRTGMRSTSACGILTNLGYENIYNLGGIINWKYEIE